MHPQQHNGSAGDAQERYQQATDGGPNKLVYGVQIGDHVGGDRARAERLVFGHGDALEAPQQPTAHPVDDVVRDARELEAALGMRNRETGSSKS